MSTHKPRSPHVTPHQMIIKWPNEIIAECPVWPRDSDKWTRDRNRRSNINGGNLISANDIAISTLPRPGRPLELLSEIYSRDKFNVMSAVRWNRERDDLPDNAIKYLRLGGGLTTQFRATMARHFD